MNKLLSIIVFIISAWCLSGCNPPDTVDEIELSYDVIQNRFMFKGLAYSGYVVRHFPWVDTINTPIFTFQATYRGQMIDGRRTMDWYTVLETGDTISMNSYGQLLSEPQTNHPSQVRYTKYDFDRIGGDTIMVADYLGDNINGWVREYFRPNDKVGNPPKAFGKNVLKTKYRQSRGYKNGLAYEYDGSQMGLGQLTRFGEYKNGKMNGEWVEYLPHEGMVTETYVNGIMHGMTKWSLNGESEYGSGQYKNGHRDGIWKQNYLNNSTSEWIHEQWRYVDDYREGQQLIYDHELGKMVISLWHEDDPIGTQWEADTLGLVEEIDDRSEPKSHRLGKEYRESDCIKVCSNQKTQISSFEPSSITVYENNLVIKGDMVDRLFGGVGLEETTFRYDDNPPTRRSEEGGYAELVYYGIYGFRVLGGGSERIAGRVRIVYDPKDGEISAIVLGVEGKCSYQVFF